MHLVDGAEEIVHIAHDILIGTSKEETEMVDFRPLAVAAQGVKRERVADVLEIDELLYRAVTVAGYIHEGGLARRVFIEPRQRHNGEKLSQCPVILQTLEDTEVADVLVAQTVLQLYDFFRDVVAAAEMGNHLLADFPVKCLHLGFIGQFQYAKGEHVVGVLLTVQRVVPGRQLFAAMEVATNL